MANKTSKQDLEKMTLLVAESLINYLISLFAQCGQTITRQQAETFISNIGLKLLEKNKEIILK